MTGPAAYSQVWLKREVSDLAPVVRTSKPYPLYFAETCSSTLPACISGGFRSVIQDSPQEEILAANLPQVLSGSFKQQVHTHTLDEALIADVPGVVSGTFRAQVRDTEVIENTTSALPSILGGTLKAVVLTYSNYDLDAVTSSVPTIISGEFFHA